MIGNGRDVDYHLLRVELGEKETYPQPRVYPFAPAEIPRLERTADRFPIPQEPEVAFVDLIKIAAEKSRTVNFEYEIVPYVPQLTK